MIAINPEKACYFIVRAWQYQAKYAVVTPDPGSNFTDESARRILEDYPTDPVGRELKDFLSGLNRDEMASLLALLWIGRGDYASEAWDEAFAEAKRIEDSTAPDYLIGTPLAADHIEQALSELGYSCDDVEREHL